MFAFFKNINDYDLRDKQKKNYFLRKIIINTKTHFYKDEKFFELLCIKSDFARYFSKFCNLYILFHTYDYSSNLYISILQDKSNFLVLLILQNAFLAPD